MSKRGQKTLTLEQFKDSMRFTYGEQYHMTDLTDYSNWVGFTQFCEQAWRNLDKRTNVKKKILLRKQPTEYSPYLKLPFIGQLYKPKEEREQ